LILIKVVQEQYAIILLLSKHAVKSICSVVATEQITISPIPPKQQQELVPVKPLQVQIWESMRYLIVRIPISSLSALLMNIITHTYFTTKTVLPKVFMTGVEATFQRWAP
jgi:hypothetical protein